MLFNLCNCAAPLISSGNPLCMGGAGFVTAVMATLAAHARTREAKRLRENVPEVDRTRRAHRHRQSHSVVRA